QDAPGDPRGARSGRGQGVLMKARNQRRRQMGGPQSAQLHGSGRARLGPMAAYGFQLDICTDANLTEKCHSVRQRGYPLSPEDGTAPGTGVDATKRCKRQGGRSPSAIGCPSDPVVVEED